MSTKLCSTCRHIFTVTRTERLQCRACQDAERRRRDEPTQSAINPTAAEPGYTYPTFDSGFTTNDSPIPDVSYDPPSYEAPDTSSGGDFGGGGGFDGGGSSDSF